MQRWELLGAKAEIRPVEPPAASLWSQKFLPTGSGRQTMVRLSLGRDVCYLLSVYDLRQQASVWKRKRFAFERAGGKIFFVKISKVVVDFRPRANICNENGLYKYKAWGKGRTRILEGDKGDGLPPGKVVHKYNSQFSFLILSID